MVAVNDTWHVVVTREGRDWLAEVQGIHGGAHTDARTLQTLDKHVREVIVLGADLPDDAMDELSVDYEYRLDDGDAERRAAVETRKKAQRLAADAEKRTALLARKYVSRGVAVRDVAAMLDISHQRVSQITAPAGTVKKAARKGTRTAAKRAAAQLKAGSRERTRSSA